MLGTLSQLVTLASAANGVLAGRFDPSSFYPQHADFKFCNSVRFVDIKRGLLGKPRETVRHNDPNAWLQALLRSKTVDVWLTYTTTANPGAPDHQLAAFVGGGGDWQLVATTAKGTEHWMSRWDVTQQGASDNRIWGVTYGCVQQTSEQSQPPHPNLQAASTRLSKALTAANEFALKHDLPSWADRFERAADCFRLQIAFPDYIDFVCLDAYPETAQRLFAAAYNGWVFGAMGSWNDLYFEPDSENARYNELSTELYSAINDGIQQATWSFAGANVG